MQTEDLASVSDLNGINWDEISSWHSTHVNGENAFLPKDAVGAKK